MLICTSMFEFWKFKLVSLLIFIFAYSLVANGDKRKQDQPMADGVPRLPDNGLRPPNMFAIDPPKFNHGSAPHQAGFVPGPFSINPGFQDLNGQPPPPLPVLLLGVQCKDNATCGPLPNSFCSNFTCQCLPSFMEDSQFPGTCRLGPGYNEPCAGGELECRQPFSCNASNFCDCPHGYIQEYFQCVRNCPSDMIPVKDKCYEGRQLEERCDTHEQCMQSYAQCLHGKCQCIPGANQINGKCYPVNQCPLGEPAKTSSGELAKCKSDGKLICPKDYYCLYPEFTESQGFCCPKIKMNCPIGKPLEGKNCSNCPWETHHCFSYVIGVYTETMCCPNACPASQPIQKDSQCYARSAYGGNCMVKEQCYNVVGAVCREDGTEQGHKRCLCPVGNYQNYFGKCMRESILGESCLRNEECKIGSNTVCLNQVCSCYQGYMPEPLKTASRTPEKCIAEPSCPTAKGVQTVEGSYEDCSENSELCSGDQFCRRWWFDGNKTYSLCCPKPRLDDYEAICQPFRMTLMVLETDNSAVFNSSQETSDQLNTNNLIPLQCDIAPFLQQQNALIHGITNDTNRPQQYCPAGTSCIFDPFSVNRGVCCQPSAAAFGAKVEKPDPVSSPTHSKRQTSNKLLEEQPTDQVFPIQLD